VTISIWFHNRSEHAHRQEETKIFLEGLKADLTHDIQEMNEDRHSYINHARIFTYISKLHLKNYPIKIPIAKYQNWLNNTTELAPNDGRFQGFKSSGKIGYIENEQFAK